MRTLRRWVPLGPLKQNERYQAGDQHRPSFFRFTAVSGGLKAKLFSDGLVPLKWRPRLFEIAAEKGLDLRASDFDLPMEMADLMAAENDLPKATHWGNLALGNAEIPSYVLNTGDRVFSLKGVVGSLMDVQGGQLAEYLKVRALQPHLPADLQPNENGEVAALFKFDTTAEGIGRFALGIKVERFNALLRAYSSALVDHALSDQGNNKLLMTAKQLEIAQSAELVPHRKPG